MSSHAARLVTCPHCGPDDATCCQCGGARIVAYAVAEQNVAWIWEIGACLCAACVRLRALHPRYA